jgi:hypothetical protein
MKNGNQGHAPQQKNQDKPGIVVVVDGTEQHGEEDGQEQKSVLGGQDGHLFSAQFHGRPFVG